MMAANELSFAGLILNIDTVKADTWEVARWVLLKVLLESIYIIIVEMLGIFVAQNCVTF